MNKLVLALSLSTASAFVGPSVVSTPTVVEGAKDELVALAESNTDALGSAIGFWDPLGASDLDFFGLELSGRLPAGATVGYLRHAEIKHGRVAMAAFVGYCIQANGIHFPWTPYPGFEEGLSPPEQWAAIPAAGKWQFLVFIGILEALGESFAPGEHYMAGGRPGVFPSLKEPNEEMLSKGVYPFHGFPLDLYDPFGTFANRSPEDKERGLRVEVNNGRLAMLGIFSFISEQKVPGAVPALSGIVKPLPDLEIMGPFVGTDGLQHIFG
ncbi:putative plastid light harvesting protein isoform 62 [Aureococcus anophagefferens]|jgi:hypothetical protein|uniref:Putative plastid light harvesting protein isoform 62 n=1 Tax=Aureococcus anophagefferens TaxID=44056 RepID=F0Y006_AURAN|nr:putative plastid light harvesting protein isoform 62 [Aureococcus anophagefferens]EGB11436.1 putative plastid light harvesting protein isoform 62 [Aureococcus anophagefferens]|eukprot:XP_009033804.1 putative plastid light harvesting protein isoform 62 [Aureococcus anophagefferens]